MERNRYLRDNIIFLAISMFGTKLISFFMVPFYTNILTPEEYGQLDVVFATVSMLVPLATLSIHQAIVRFLLEPDADKQKVFSVGLHITMAGVLLAAVVAVIFPRYWWICLLMSINSLYLLAAESVRGLGLMRLYAGGNIFVAIITAGLNIWFLSGLRLGISGYIGATAISYMASIFLFVWKGHLCRYVVFKGIPRDLVKQMLNFSIYLIPNTLMWWITASSDKYVIKFFMGDAANGIYAIAGKIPLMIVAVSQIFTQAWQLTAIKDQYAQDRAEYVNARYRDLFIFLLLAASGILLLLKPFLYVYVSSKYFIAYQSAAILIISAVFGILATFIGTTYVVEKDNKSNMLSTALGAGVNIVLNILLIPFTGMVGAAIATAASYIIVVLYRLRDTKRYVRIEPFDARLICCVIIMLLQAVTVNVAPPLISALNLCLFIAMIWMTNKTWRAWIGLISAKLKEFRNKRKAP